MICYLLGTTRQTENSGIHRKAEQLGFSLVIISDQKNELSSGIPREANAKLYVLSAMHYLRWSV